MMLVFNPKDASRKMLLVEMTKDLDLPLTWFNGTNEPPCGTCKPVN